MASLPLPRGTWLLLLGICLVLLPGKAAAFGAGNIPSIAQVCEKYLRELRFSRLTLCPRSKDTTGAMEVCRLPLPSYPANIDVCFVDIEDMLASVAFLQGKKWTSMLIKRTYFGNWLRDYSQAVDVGSLKGVNAATVRILVS